MRRKVRNWAAFLLALALVLGMIPAAYAAGYSITVNAPTGNNLPYWVFEKVGVDSADVLNLTANEGHTLPTNKVARVSLAVGKNKEDEAACGISINGMYYVQSVTLDRYGGDPDRQGCPMERGDVGQYHAGGGLQHPRPRAVQGRHLHR